MERGVSLSVVTRNNSASKIYLKLAFSITQDRKDESLVRSFEYFLGCGKFYATSTRTTVEYQCRKFSDNYEKNYTLFSVNII